MFKFVERWEISEDLDYGDHRLVNTSLALELPLLPKRRYKTKGVGFKKFNEKFDQALKDENINFENLSTPSDFEYE